MMVTTSFQECLVSKAFSRDTHEPFCFAILSYLIHPVSTHTIYTHITHILKECFSEIKPQPQPLRVRDCHTYNPLHNPLWFSSTPTSSFPNPREVDSPNTYHTYPECKVRFWCCWVVLEEAICLVDVIGLNCVIWKAREHKAWRSQLVTRAWRAQVHGVDQAWRVFCYLCTPTYSLVDRFTAWRAAKRFYIEFFSFLFDDTSACYLVFAFFFPTLLTFILLL